MAASVNSATILGRLGADPDYRTSQAGNGVAQLSVATNERVKDGDGWKETVEWHRVVAFGKTADNCNQYLRKGSQVYIEGKIQTRKWQDRDGVDRYTTEIVAWKVLFLDKPEGGSGGNRPPHPAENAGGNEPAGGDDDFPFAPCT